MKKTPFIIQILRIWAGSSKRRPKRTSKSLCVCRHSMKKKTIAKEIIILKSELMTRYPLLDEIVVVDSGSTDKTTEIARARTAPMCMMLPEFCRTWNNLKAKAKTSGKRFISPMAISSFTWMRISKIFTTASPTVCSVRS